MSADAFIQVRVAPEVKGRLQALAERKNITESALDPAGPALELALGEARDLPVCF
jgi:predicted transcriptional regulator